MRFAYLALCCLLVAGYHANIADTPISRMQVPWWKQRFDQKQIELRLKSPELVWFGDSITQDWERNGPEPWLQFAPIWQRFYGPRAVDLGFKGDSTCHLLWRLLHGELDGYKPKVAIILIGANNFGHVHTDADATFTGIVDIVSLVRTKTPATRIILVGVLPSMRSSWVDDNTKRLNARLGAAFEGNAMVTFMDASALFVLAGKVNEDDFIDSKMTPAEPSLHPTALAQERLAVFLQPVVQRDLGIAGR